MTNQRTFTPSALVLSIALALASPGGSCETASATGHPAHADTFAGAAMLPTAPLARGTDSTVIRLPFAYHGPAETHDGRVLPATQRSRESFLPSSSNPYVRVRGGHDKIYRVTAASGAMYAEGLDAGTSLTMTERQRHRRHDLGGSAPAASGPAGVEAKNTAHATAHGAHDEGS
jgi:hypothetical protein